MRAIYTIIIVLRDKKIVDRFSVAKIHIEKDLESHLIQKVFSDASFSKRLSWKEVLSRLKYLKENRSKDEKTDFFLTTEKNITKDSIYVSYYAIKNEHELIECYLQNQTKIRFFDYKHQVFKENTEFFLEENKAIKRFQLDHDNINTETYGILHAIKLVEDDKIKPILHLLKTV